MSTKSCTVSPMYSSLSPSLPLFSNIAVLEGDNCVFDGVIYRSGEKFQPNCQYLCTCRDGQIGCVPRCQLDVLLPHPDCPAPRKVAVPGECCEKWTCDPDEKRTLGGITLPGETLQMAGEERNKGRKPGFEMTNWPKFLTIQLWSPHGPLRSSIS